MVKYDKNTDCSPKDTFPLNRSELTRALSAKGGKVDTPEISILLDFLRLHVLNIKSKTKRDNSYQDRTGNIYAQKSLSDLMEYCRDNLGLEIENEEYKTPDFLIDIITICFVIGRHLLPAQKLRLNGLLPQDSDAILISLLREKNPILQQFIAT